MKEAQTDPLTKLYDTWPTDDGFFRKQDILKLSGRGTKEPVCRMLFQHPNCPTELIKPDGSSWNPKDFKLKKQLSSSDTCVVYIAYARPSGFPVVLKIHCKTRLSAISKHQLAREVHVHSRLDHPNILQLYGTFEDDKTVCMVMEFAKGGDLMGKLMAKKTQRFTEAEAKDVVVPVLSALECMHQRGVVHRDIKPENIIYTDKGTVKFIDFGVAIDSTKERPVSAVGTVDYMSPEAASCPLKSRPSQYKEKSELYYGAAVDVWAVGILACDMIGGKTPFEPGTSDEIKACIRAGKLTLPPNMSSGLANFVAMTTQLNPTERPTCSQLLRHEWLAGCSALREVESRLTSSSRPATPVKQPSTPSSWLSQISTGMRPIGTAVNKVKTLTMQHKAENGKGGKLSPTTPMMSSPNSAGTPELGSPTIPASMNASFQHLHLPPLHGAPSPSVSASSLLSRRMSMSSQLDKNSKLDSAGSLLSGDAASHFLKIRRGTLPEGQAADVLKSLGSLRM